MSNFSGNWIGGTTKVTISENQNLLTIKLPNRPVATGFEVDLFAPTINAVFPDDAPFTGVLSEGNKILWSNGTTWIRDHHTGIVPAPGPAKP
jgi:hypothetical protein